MGSKRVDEAVDEILKRAARTGLTDQQIHERADLSNGTLSQMRRGVYGPGAGTVKKLRRFLERFEAGATKGEAAPTAAEVMAAAVGEPGRPLVFDAGLSIALIDRATRAKTARQMDRVERDLTRATLTGGDLERIDLALSILKERRQLIRAKREEKAKAQVRALWILTPEEMELVKAHRAKLAGPALKPGEPAPPPIEPAP